MTTALGIGTACTPGVMVTDTDTDPSTTEPETTEGPTTTVEPTTTEEPTTEEPTTETTETTETTDPSTTIEPTTIELECEGPDGEVDESCDAETPFCVNNECETCAGASDPDASCAGVDPAMGVCDLVDGACVECTADNAAACSDATPACDELSLECVACTEHSQCPDSACELTTGSCFPADAVLYVDKAFGMCEQSDGSFEAPFCDVALAFAYIGENNEPPAPWTVKVIGAGVYTHEVLLTPESSTIALMADGVAVRIRGTSNEADSASIKVTAGSTLYSSHISYDNHEDQNGVGCEGGTLWLSDASVSNNAAYGLFLVDCEAHARRLAVWNNSEGGVYATGLMSETHIDTTYITENGSPQSLFGGVGSTGGNALSLNFVSLINNLGNGTASVHCSNSAGVAIRNSILVGFNQPTIDCDTLTIDTSATDVGDDLGTGNLLIEPGASDDWFSPMNALYKPEAEIEGMPSPLTDVADWAEGDPRYDYSGQLRSLGGADFPGADLPD
ncbi:MAG: hypothetical protein ACPG77_04795 [Nannocystaceae bacterium]